MTYTNGQNYLDRVNLIYYALISVPLLLFAIVYLNYYRDELLIPMNRALSWGYILMAATSVILAGLSRYHYQRKLNTIAGKNLLRDKLNYWYEILLRNYWLIGALSLGVVVALYTSKSQVFVACYAILLFMVSFLRPTQQRLIRELKLKSEQLKMIEQNQEISF